MGTDEIGAFTPDGKTIATGTRQGGLALWDASTGQPTGTLSAQARLLYSLAFSPDGSRVATARRGPTTVWDVAGGSEIARVDGQAALFHPDGSTVTTFERDTVLTWDIETQTQLASRRSHVRDITFIALSPKDASLSAAPRTERHCCGTSPQPSDPRR